MRHAGLRGLPGRQFLPDRPTPASSRPTTPGGAAPEHIAPAMHERKGMARNGPPMEKARRRARQPITSNRSTSTIPMIGDLQMRDHRQAQEGQLQERLFQHHPQRPARPRAARPASSRTSSNGSRLISPATGSASSASTRPPSTTTNPPSISRQPVRRHRHVGVIRPHHRDVVVVVADGRRDRPPLQPEALHEARRDVAVHPVPLDHRDLHQIAGDVRALVAVLRARCRRSDAR